MTNNQLNPFVNFHDIIEEVRRENNKGKVPHISIAEPRIGRPIQEEYVNYIKKIGNKDVRPGDGHLLLPKVRGWKIEKNWRAKEGFASATWRPLEDIIIDPNGEAGEEN